MKALNYTIYPTFHSMKRLIFWIGLICVLLSAGSLLCIAGSPKGIDWQALRIFIGMPFGFILIPVLAISFSYRIKVFHHKIIFHMFFLPVKTISLEEIKRVKFDKIASNGQPCAITVEYDNKEYSYPARLFEKHIIKKLIDDLNDAVSINTKLKNNTNDLQSPVFDFSNSEMKTKFIRYLAILFFIILVILLWGKQR